MSTDSLNTAHAFHPVLESVVPVSGSSATSKLQALAAEQGVAAVERPDELRGDVWPENDIDDFLRTLRSWRREDGR
jgi:hypothetical protein